MATTGKVTTVTFFLNTILKTQINIIKSYYLTQRYEVTTAVWVFKTKILQSDVTDFSILYTGWDGPPLACNVKPPLAKLVCSLLFFLKQTSYHFCVTQSILTFKMSLKLPLSHKISFRLVFRLKPIIIFQLFGVKDQKCSWKSTSISIGMSTVKHECRNKVKSRFSSAYLKQIEIWSTYVKRLFFHPNYKTLVNHNSYSLIKHNLYEL